MNELATSVYKNISLSFIVTKDSKWLYVRETERLELLSLTLS